MEHDYRLEISNDELFGEDEKYLQILGSITEQSVLWKFITFVNDIGLQGGKITKISVVPDIMNGSEIMVFRAEQVNK